MVSQNLLSKEFLCHFHFFGFQKPKKIPGQLSRIPQLWLFGVDTSQNKEPLECPSKRVLLYKHEKKYFHILISATLENMSPERSCKIHWYSDESLADCRKTNTNFQRRLFLTLHREHSLTPWNLNPFILRSFHKSSEKGSQPSTRMLQLSSDQFKKFGKQVVKNY